MTEATRIIVEELQARIDFLIKDNTRLKTKLQDADVKITKLELVLEDKIKQVERLEGEIATLEANATERMAQLDGIIEQLREQMQRLIEESKK